jgi:hypothetical protein
MKNFIRGLLITLTLLCASTALAQTQNVSVTTPLIQMTDIQYAQFSTHINEVRAEIDDAEGAEAIITRLLSGTTTDTIDPTIFEDRDFYCIIHVLNWAPPPAAGNQTVLAQTWYLYNKHKLTRASSKTIPRLFGAKEVTLLYVHLNKAPANAYTPLYEVEIVKKTPAYLSHLLGLAGIFSSVAGPAGIAAATPINHWWAFRRFQVQYRVSDITVAPKVTRTASVEDLGAAQQFDNEGKYRGDFSVGVPIRKISELNFDSTNNAVTPKEVDKTSILALVNVYPVPVDIRSTNATFMPHFVGGVAIDRQPFNKIFVGTGFGPVVANVYIGALFVKQPKLNTLQPGDPATQPQIDTDTRRRFKAQFAFGLNLPVGAIIEKLKGN